MNLKLHTYFITVSLLVISQIVNAQSITIAYQNDYPPYSYTGKNGEPRGVIVELMTLWAEQEGFQAEFVPCSTSTCLDLISAKKVDMLAGTFIKEDSLDLVYSSFVLRLSISIFAKENIKLKPNLELEDSVAVIKDSRTHRIILSMFPDMKLKLYNSYDEFQTQINNREISIYAIEMPDPISEKFHMVIPNGYHRVYHILSDELRPAVRRDNIALSTALLRGTQDFTKKNIIDVIKKYNFHLVETKNRSLYFITSISLIIIMSFALIYRKKRLSKAIIITDFEDIDWHSIIKSGENDKVEFKSSLRWDYYQEKVNKALEHVIFKTIAAFLNTEGGILFIGLDDAGNLLGLENDYETMKKKNKDSFLVTLTGLINLQFGKDVHRLVKINICTIEHKDVCIIKVIKSDKPVFLLNKKEEAFFIRASASSQPLSMSETVEYIKGHFKE